MASLDPGCVARGAGSPRRRVSSSVQMPPRPITSAGTTPSRWAATISSSSPLDHLLGEHDAAVLGRDLCRRPWARAISSGIAEPDLDTADLGLVLDRGGAHLQHDRTWARERCDRVLGRGDHPPGGDGDAGVAQQRLGLVLGQPLAGSVPARRVPRGARRGTRSHAGGRHGGRGGVGARVRAAPRAHRSPVRSPATAGTPAAAKSAAAWSSSSSGRVEETSVTTSLRSAPSWMPSRTAAHDSAAAPVRSVRLVVEDEDRVDRRVGAQRLHQPGERLDVAPDHRRVVERVGGGGRARQERFELARASRAAARAGRRRGVRPRRRPGRSRRPSRS